MPRKKQVKPGEKLPLKLTAAQRKLVLDGLIALDPPIEHTLRNTPTDQPVMLSLNDLDDFGRYIAAAANHCDDKQKAKKLDVIFEKVEALLDKFTDEAPPQTVNFEDARTAKLLAENSVQIADFAAKILVAADQLGIKSKPLEQFWLAPAQRDVLLIVPSMTKAIKNKLAKQNPTFTVAEVASMSVALAEDLTAGDARQQVAVLHLAKHLMDQLQAGIVRAANHKIGKESKGKPKIASDLLFQFKITLLGIEPAIWRRIQVQDCTLDKLHEHIQTAMGWTNSHLHQFDIKGRLHGDPELLVDYFEEFDCVDSTTTLVSVILPRDGKRFAFTYEYDFGDGWEHEVLFEGCPPVEKGKKYPLCLEGERSCPPEDVGGIWGYQSLLAPVSDPKHKEHRSLLRWCGGKFSAEAFDPDKATKEMKKGLPDWRSMK